MLKFLSYAIVLQEVPNEITLALNITNCPHKCKGCHSPELCEDIGEPLFKNLQSLIIQYDGYISCVCFMGGDQCIKDLLLCLKLCKAYGLKTCIYSGSDDLNVLSECFEYLDWIKIGSYKQELATNDNICYGVKLATSNQKLLKQGVDF